MRETSEISKQMWQKLRVKQKGKEVGDIYPSLTQTLNHIDIS